MAETRKQRVLRLDCGTSIEVDEEDFEIIKLLLKDVGADLDLKKVIDVVRDLVAQGWGKLRAIEVCLLARKEI